MIWYDLLEKACPSNDNVSCYTKDKMQNTEELFRSNTTRVFLNRFIQASLVSHLKKTGEKNYP